MEVYTTCLVTCVLGTMMMAINQPCWDCKLISLQKMIEDHMNMVPNEWLTRKMMVLRESHVNLIITCIA